MASLKPAALLALLLACSALGVANAGAYGNINLLQMAQVRGREVKAHIRSFFCRSAAF